MAGATVADFLPSSLEMDRFPRSLDLCANQRSVLCFGEVICVPKNAQLTSSVSVGQAELRDVQCVIILSDGRHLEVIREMRFDGRGWSVSNFTQTGARLGTALAAVSEFLHEQVPDHSRYNPKMQIAQLCSLKMKMAKCVLAV